MLQDCVYNNKFFKIRVLRILILYTQQMHIETKHIIQN